MTEPLTEKAYTCCSTCGLRIEPPDEEIAAGDYWKIDAADAAGKRCPECRQFPSDKQRGRHALALYERAGRPALCPRCGGWDGPALPFCTDAGWSHGETCSKYDYARDLCGRCASTNRTPPGGTT